MIVDVPTPAMAGQNWVPLTPLPDQRPPGGFPLRVTHGAFTQYGPSGSMIGIMLSMKTFKVTGGLTQPAAFVAKTDTPFGINPGDAVPQLTTIALVPCPLTITPGDTTVQV